MKTHFIYNRKTGQIVHIHVSDDHQDISREGILQKGGLSSNKSELDVLTTDEPLETGPVKIDITNKILVKDDSNENSVSGFAGLKRPNSINFPKNVKTVYKKVK